MGGGGGRGRVGGHSCNQLHIGNKMDVKQGLIKSPSIKRHLKREIILLFSFFFSFVSHLVITNTLQALLAMDALVLRTKSN